MRLTIIDAMREWNKAIEDFDVALSSFCKPANKKESIADKFSDFGFNGEFTLPNGKSYF